jgi:hypothetical protein
MSSVQHGRLPSAHRGHLTATWGTGNTDKDISLERAKLLMICIVLVPGYDHSGT